MSATPPLDELKSSSKNGEHRKSRSPAGSSSRSRHPRRSKSPRKSRRHRSRSRSKSRRRDRSRSKSRGRRERTRSPRRSSRRSRDRSKSRRDRSISRRDRSISRRGRSRSRSYDRRRERNHRDRSKSRSYDRRRFDNHFEFNRSSMTRDRSYMDDRSDRVKDKDRDRESNSRLEAIKEESKTRENRFDLTQTIQELINSSSSKNFASFFSTNSNDSFSNGHSENSQDAIERKRRKKSRWGENDKTFIPGMPTYLPSTLDPTQQEAYLVQLQIEEISRKLRTGELGIPQNPEERSPSPEPIYSSDGKRLNTREYRCRKKLEEQRHQLIQKMQAVNPDFKPPADYKPPVTRVSDKVLIPQEEHPDINFVGLLIGPRGNTLKAMEKETGAKIIIRGKGSIKEGKVGRKDGLPLPGEDEPLHAFITAPNLEAVKKAVDKVKDVIRQGIEVPQGHNDLRRMQLRELAQLNGTLRETDCPRCTNCGSTEHKSWLCPDKQNVTNSIICTSCGGAGHISKDCRLKRPGAGGVGDEQTEDSQAKIDEEYMSLMAELGEGPPPANSNQQTQQPKSALDQLAQVHLNRGFSIFDKKPTQMQAIQAAPAPPPTTAPPPIIATAPPPPMPPPGWNSVPPAPMPAIPPLIPPPNAQPPAPPAPLMPWIGTQPPIPGGDVPLLPPPPGTSAPMPPPPGTAAPLPPWTAPPGIMPPGFGTSWPPYIPPPPPPACQPPPPPPPSN